MPEQLLDYNANSTVLTGGYTTGSGVLNVVDTTPFGGTAPFVVEIVDQTTGDTKVVLKVTAITSGTQFAVSPETTDTAASAGDFVNAVLSKGALTRYISDAVLFGTFASLPSAGRAGRTYFFTDSLYSHAIDDGSAWKYFVQGKLVAPPSGFTTQNASSSVLTTTNGGESLLSAVGTSGNNVTGRYVTYPTAPFTRTFCLQLTPAQVNGSGGPTNGTAGIYISDGSAVEYFGCYGVSNLAIQYGPAVNNITTNVITPRYTALFNNIMWLRIDDGVNTAGQRTFWFSFDGINFFQFWQESNTAQLTPTRLGFFTQAFDMNTLVNVWCLGYQ